MAMADDQAAVGHMATILALSVIDESHVMALTAMDQPTTADDFDNVKKNLRYANESATAAAKDLARVDGLTDGTSHFANVARRETQAAFSHMLPKVVSRNEPTTFPQLFHFDNTPAPPAPIAIGVHPKRGHRLRDLMVKWKRQVQMTFNQGARRRRSPSPP